MKFVLPILFCAIAAGATGAHLWRTSHAVVQLSTGEVLRPRRPLGDFSLIDHRQQSFTPANLRGQWSLLFFGYTHCPDFCPATLSLLSLMQQQLREAKVALPQVIFVLVDAKRDTPDKLAQYVPYFDAGFLGVTAKDQPTIEAIARQWGVAVIVQPSQSDDYTVDHSGSVFAIDPSGRIAAILTGPFSADSLRRDYMRLLASRA